MKRAHGISNHSRSLAGDYGVTLLSAERTFHLKCTLSRKANLDKLMLCKKGGTFLVLIFEILFD